MFELSWDSCNLISTGRNPPGSHSISWHTVFVKAYFTKKSWCKSLEWAESVSLSSAVRGGRKDVSSTALGREIRIESVLRQWYLACACQWRTAYLQHTQDARTTVVSISSTSTCFMAFAFTSCVASQRNQGPSRLHRGCARKASHILSANNFFFSLKTVHFSTSFDDERYKTWVSLEVL